MSAVIGATQAVVAGSPGDPPAVAVVGMSGRFPGAGDVSEYWARLRAAECCITDFSPAELRAAGVDAAESARPGYVAAKGYLADADRFEAELFGVSRAEAAVLDPQHRLLLETAWGVLEDAGFDPRRPPGRTGVYVGGSLTEHMIAAQVDPRLAAELGGMQVRILTDREFLASWLSYRLGLDGPSVTVQTACSTSLTAVHVAVQALLLGECDAAIAGGVAVDSVRKRGYRYLDGGIFSPDGRCRPFDVRAAGTVGGNGVGLVLLRRLSDAVADGDPVRAVVLGTAVTNDGADKVGFTAPSVAAQARAIAEAWWAAGLDPAAAQYLELHGTGTDLGDRVEIAAASAALGDRPGGRCGIGSVKATVGHLDAAAGVAGLIKVALMLEHATMVPTANASQPQPGLADGPLRLVTEVTPWRRPEGGRRLAGVSSVGIGGTNVHVVMAEAPPLSVPAGGSTAERLELLPVSARTEGQLRTVAGRLAGLLTGPGCPALADVAHTMRTGRAALPVRGYVVAATAAGAAAALADVAAGRSAPLPAGAADLAALGDVWVGGAEVPWPAPAVGARRVHLPTYPFAGERFGALPPVSGNAAVATTEAPGRDGADVARTRAVTEMLAGTLGLRDPAELDGSYLEAGGDSLTAVHLAGRLRDELGFDVPIEVFLEPIALRDLAARIVSRDDDSMLAVLLGEELDAEARQE